MRLGELNPGNTKHARDTAISAFNAFTRSENIAFDYVKQCIEQDATVREMDLQRITLEQQAHANELLAAWVAKSLRPFSIVNDSGFRAYVRYIAEDLGGVKVKVPSRTKLHDDIIHLASRLRVSVRKIIKKEWRYFSVTTDNWTSMNTDSYLSLTLHYVTPDFRFRNGTPEVESFPGRHSGEAISEGLLKLFERWGLEREYCAKLLRDGASNAVLAGALLHIDHMSCVAHSLHLVLAGVLIKRRPRRNTASSRITAHGQTVLSPIRHNNNALAHFDATIPSQSSDTSTGRVTSTRAMGSGATGPGYEETAGERDNELGGDEEDEEYEDVVEAEQWLQERAFDELAEFLDTWCEMEDLTSLDTLRDTVHKFRKIAIYVHKSPKAKKWLEKTQKERLGIHPVHVVIDCPTRWNSARNMLARMLGLKEPLALFFSHLKSPIGIVNFKDVTLASPDPSDWFAVKCLLYLLDPFATVTEELSGGYPILAVAVTFLRYIQQKLARDDIFEDAISLEGRHDYVDNIIDLMKSVQRALQRLFDKRFNHLPADVLWISLLDPRLTRMRTLSNFEKRQAKDLLLQNAIEIATSIFPVPSPVEVRPSPSPNRRRKQHRSDARETVFGVPASRRSRPEVDPTEHARRLEMKCETEMNDYFTLTDDGTTIEDPHLWWKEKSVRFPVLGQLASKWLGYVATSVPSERAFSSAGNIVAAKHSRLDPNVVRDLVFIHENYNEEIAL